MAKIIIATYGNSRCGCPDCKDGVAPKTRQQWMSRKNKHGNYYGTFKNPAAKHHGRRSIS